MKVLNIKDIPSHIDERGEIQMIIENCDIGSISKIHSNPNSIRANHYHPIDEHTILVIEGQVEYYERERIYKENKLKYGNLNRIVLNKNDIYHTVRNFEHTMYFPCDTTFLCFSKLPRNQENYEKETIRVPYDLRNLYNGWEV